MSTDTPTPTPLGDAIAKIGADGEGFSVGATQQKDGQPAATVGGYVEFGTRDQFGLGVAAQYAKDWWAWAAKFVWKPGGTKGGEG